GGGRRDQRGGRPAQPERGQRGQRHAVLHLHDCPPYGPAVPTLHRPQPDAAQGGPDLRRCGASAAPRTAELQGPEILWTRHTPSKAWRVHKLREEGGGFRSGLGTRSPPRSGPAGAAGSGSWPGSVDPGEQLRSVVVGRAVTARVLGLATRGTTNPNRLRRVDRWIAGTQASRLRDAADPLVIDLGYGASPVTTIELAGRLRGVRPDVRVLGLEIDPDRGRAAAPLADPPGLDFARGGFEVAGRRPGVGRARNGRPQAEPGAPAPAAATLRSRPAPRRLA